MRPGLIPGVNVDLISVEAGMAELSECGWPEDGQTSTAMTRHVVEYALQRWARGEEDAALRGAIDPSFYGIDLTSWTRVLAAAKAGGTL